MLPAKAGILSCLLAIGLFAVPRAVQMAAAGNGFDLTIHVTYEDGAPVRGQVQVQLLNQNRTVISQRSTNGEGVVSFSRIESPEGLTARIFGVGLEDTLVDLALPSEERESVQWVHVRRSQQTHALPPDGSATVSVAELHIPPKAQKELDRGVADLSKNRLDSARQHLAKAVALYPKYPAALNDLGVLAMREHDEPSARTYFQAALQADDHLADTYANLAKLDYEQSRWQDADTMVSRAVKLNPEDVDSLVMLAKLQLRSSQYSQATTTAAKVHSLPHLGFAIVHIIAAKAYYAEKLNKGRLANYNSFSANRRQDRWRRWRGSRLSTLEPSRRRLIELAGELEADIAALAIAHDYIHRVDILRIGFDDLDSQTRAGVKRLFDLGGCGFEVDAASADLRDRAQEIPILVVRAHLFDDVDAREPAALIEVGHYFASTSLAMV